MPLGGGMVLLGLDLAQVREIEAFSALRLDLDAATRRQLDRGAEQSRSPSKQPQYAPRYAVDEQVMIVFAVTRQLHERDVPVAALRESRVGGMAADLPQVGDGLRTGKTLTKEIEADLRRGASAYKKTAVTTKPAGVAEIGSVVEHRHDTLGGDEWSEYRDLVETVENTRKITRTLRDGGDVEKLKRNSATASAPRAPTRRRWQRTASLLRDLWRGSPAAAPAGEGQARGRHSSN